MRCRPTALTIARADLADPQVAALVERHQRGMIGASPPGTAFALDLSGLSDPVVTVLGAWCGGDLAAIGALKRLGPGHAELKSMRTADSHLRRGVGAAMLDALIDLARAEGVTRLSLETGSGPAFEPALALYRRRGFVGGPAFSDYRNTEFNQCLHLNL